MVYEPLHHKYRPQTFTDLVGQEAITTTLSNALVSNRIAPAYLFTGPRGTGKTSSARILAKSLNCLQFEQPTPQPCGQCDICQAIARGSALDVIEIDAASNTGVDNIREIIERAQFAPVQCRYKVYVIDECHMLSQAAFNALLKTLEEPPERVIFVLATTDPQRVLPTIISRCQRFDYRRIPLAPMVAHLTHIAQQETIEIDSAALNLVGQLANGGLRDAESLLDQLSLLSGTITPDKVWQLVGAVPERELLELIQAIRSSQPPVVIEQCRQLLDRGREPLVVLQNLAGAYLNLLLAKTAPSRPDLVAVTESTWTALCHEAQTWQREDILRGQQHLRDSEVQLKNTTQPRLWLEIILLGLLTNNAPQKGSLEPAIAQKTPATPLTHQSSSSVSNGTLMQATTPPNQPIPITPQADNPIIPPPPVVSTVKPPPNSQSAEDIALTQPQLGTTSAPELEPAIANNQEATTTPTSNISALTSSISTIEASDLSATWEKILDKVSPLTKALMRPHCYLLSLDETVAAIGIRSEPLLKIAQTKQSELEDALKTVFNRPISARIQITSATPSGNGQPIPPKTESRGSTRNNERSIISESTLDQTEAIIPAPPIEVSNLPVSVDPTILENIPPPENSSIANHLKQAVNSDKIIDQKISPISDQNDEAQELVNQAAANIAKLFSGEIIDLEDAQDKITADNHSEVEGHNKLNHESMTAENNEEYLAESSKPLTDDEPQPIIRGRPNLSEIDDAEDIPF